MKLLLTWVHHKVTACPTIVWWLFVAIWFFFWLLLGVAVSMDSADREEPQCANTEQGVRCVRLPLQPEA